MAQQSFASISSPLPKSLPGLSASDHSILPFEPDLLQILQTSKTPEAAIHALIHRASRLLRMEACVVVMVGLNPCPRPAWIWRPDAGLTLAQECQLANHILSHPTLPSSLTLDKTVAVLDLKQWLQAARSATALDPQAEDEAQNELRLENMQVSYQSALLCPAQYQRKTSGVLILLRSDMQPWTEMETQVLNALSTQIAIALAQGHLQQQVEQQLQQQSLIYRLVEVIREGWDLDPIYQLAVDGLVNLLQVSRGMVLSFKYADPQMKGRTSEVSLPRTRATVDYVYTTLEPSPPALHGVTNLSSWHRYSFQMNDCEIGRQIVEAIHDPVVIPPLAASGESMISSQPWVAHGIAPLFDLRAMPALLVIPLEHQGIGLGCLVLQHHQPRSWHPDDLALVRLVATHISTAMIQSKTLRKVQALVEERTSQLRHSLDVQAKLYEKTRQQVDQLQRMNQVMEEFLSTVSHELLTPLTSMKMAIRMLREAPLTPDQRDRYLGILDNQCTQETHLIRDLLTIQKIESHTTQLQVHQVDLQYIIRDLHQSWMDSLQESQLTFRPHLPERPILMRTDPESLHRILTELLTNARKYSDPGTIIDMDVFVDTAQSVPQVILTVQNTGIGILPDELPMIFEKFRRGRQAIHRALPGIGLGLALARGLAVHLSGAIIATSTPIADTQSWQNQFILTLPLSPELAP